MISHAVLPLFFLQLAYPTLSYAGQQTPQKRLNPVRPMRLSAINTDNSNDDPVNVNDNANIFEQAVRKVTRNKNYKFGDLTKSAANASTKTIEGAVRTVTRDDDYHFGDYSKKVLSTGTGTFESAVKSITGNEEYKFGDLTRNVVGTVKTTSGSIITYSEKTLSLLRDANIHELVELLNLFWTNSMTFEERREAFAVLIYLGAIIVLAYNFIANLMSGIVFSVAWYKVAIATGLSPVASWPTFLQTKATLDMFFGGPCLPLRVAATIPWFFNYRKLVVATAYFSPLREKFPIINRCISLLLSWFIVNLALVGGMTFVMIAFASLRSGVPIFS